MKTNNKSGRNNTIRSSQNIISIIFLSLVSILALSYCIVILLTNASLRRQNDAAASELAALESEGYYTKVETEQLIENALNEQKDSLSKELKDKFKEDLEEKGTLYAIKDLFSDQLVVSYNGGYHFFDISEEIEKSPFANTDFAYNEGGLLDYVGISEDVHAAKGIDVSRFQGEIDFSKVKKSGIDFVMIRAGLRGTTEGALLEDDYFESNITKARAAGLEVGVYFYSQAVSAAEAREEAQFVLELIKPYKITYPVAIDIEANDSSDARTYMQDSATYASVAESFCTTIENAGYKPMIYGNIRTFLVLLENMEKNKWPVWIADYNENIYYPYKFDMWQYSSEGNIDGVDGNVDVNICVTDFNK